MEALRMALSGGGSQCSSSHCVSALNDAFPYGRKCKKRRCNSHLGLGDWESLCSNHTRNAIRKRRLDYLRLATIWLQHGPSRKYNYNRYAPGHKYNINALDGVTSSHYWPTWCMNDAKPHRLSTEPSWASRVGIRTWCGHAPRIGFWWLTPLHRQTPR